jgi:hypothetical protein
MAAVFKGVEIEFFTEGVDKPVVATAASGTDDRKWRRFMRVELKSDYKNLALVVRFISS